MALQYDLGLKSEWNKNDRVWDTLELYGLYLAMFL